MYVHLKCLVLFLHHSWWERAFRLGKLYSIQQIIVSASQFFQLTRRNSVDPWMAVVGLSGSHAQNPRSLSQTGKKYGTCTLTIPSILFAALESVAFYCNLLHWHPPSTWRIWLLLQHGPCAGIVVDIHWHEKSWISTRTKRRLMPELKVACPGVTDICCFDSRPPICLITASDGLTWCS